MPPRTSSRTRSSAARAEAPSGSHEYRHVIASHGSLLTILWVVLLFLSLGIGLTLFVQKVRMDADGRSIAVLSQRVDELQRRVMLLSQPASPVATPTTAVGAPNVLPTNVSASGLLERGSLSPDGTKYAGYDVTTKGKIGIGVEILQTKQVKHIVIFNPNTESTGNGTTDESNLSVRWVDSNTIEYDLLVKKGGAWVKEVQTVNIFF